MASSTSARFSTQIAAAPAMMQHLVAAKHSQQRAITLAADIPADVAATVLTFLTQSDVITARRVCKTWRAAADSPSVQAHLYRLILGPYAAMHFVFPGVGVGVGIVPASDSPNAGRLAQLFQTALMRARINATKGGDIVRTIGDVPVVYEPTASNRTSAFRDAASKHPLLSQFTAFLERLLTQMGCFGGEQPNTDNSGGSNDHQMPRAIIVQCHSATPDFEFLIDIARASASEARGSHRFNVFLDPAEDNRLDSFIRMRVNEEGRQLWKAKRSRSRNAAFTITRKKRGVPSGAGAAHDPVVVLSNYVPALRSAPWLLRRNNALLLVLAPPRFADHLPLWLSSMEGVVTMHAVGV